METFTSDHEQRGSSRERGGDRWVDRLALAVSVLVPLGLAAKEAMDPDLWWHMATGRYILTHRLIPATDVFSFSAVGHRWVTHEWLTDVLLYAGYQAVGHAGLSLLFAALIGAAFGLVYLRCRARPAVSALAVAAAALASMATWGARPQMISLFFTSLYLYILEREPAGGGRTVWLLAPLTMLWANLHSGYLTGIAIIGVTAVGSELQWLRERRQGPLLGPRARMLALVAVAALACGLVTPNGLSGAAFPFGTLSNRLIQDKIVEWFSVDFHRPWAWPILAFWLLLLGSLALSRRRVTATQFALLLGAAGASLYSVRHVVFLSLIGGPIVAEHAGNVIQAGGGRPTSRRAARLLGAGLGVALMVLAIGVGTRAVALVRERSEVVESLYPVAAVDYLEQQGLEGRIYNTYHWGGYLIWRGLPVFIDGRAEVYGDEVLGDWLLAHEVRVDWEKPLDAYDVGLVLVQSDSRLAVLLHESARWQAIYEDELAVVFQRASEERRG